MAQQSRQTAVIYNMLFPAAETLFSLIFDDEKK